MKTQRKTPSRRVAFCAAFAVLLSSVGIAHAQDSDEETTSALSIPQDLKIFGENDPNVRRAAVRVNGDIITGTDIDQRLALVLAANTQPMSPEETERLRLQVLRNLIDETLEIQEAKAQEIQVDPAEIEQTYARVAAQNFGQNTQAMDEYLGRIGSSPTSLKRQIEGELAWQRLLRRNVQPYVNVSEEEVNELLARLKASRGTSEYRIGEIYLSANSANRASVFENAKRIVEQLSQGGSFVAYARQFSEASTAAVGGDLGWVRLAQLPTELATVARDMDRGQLVGPVEVPGGFSIIYLIDKRQVLMADPRDALLSLKQISLAFPASTSEQDAQKKAASFAEGVKRIKGCGDADSAADALGASIVTNDNVRIRDLPAPLQQLMLSLQVGETTPPFGSAKEGVSVLMLCGRDEAATNDGPSFDDLMTQIEDERVNKRAQRYLRDLRRDAVIEYN
ncbi:peptidylprolyl isomerase [Croceicoccus estronivorus]|uniref:peptidylprolyl isomerase n=1 Tax=Croceicoccus estronivorus TaxID=1172626 RepID=UPI000835E49F|nr:peptidylprolyl isomerase [Croceicoccus estronivorus]OCC22540.1 peptidylprolyl isomerase [Croceicoccus estronivorus]